MTKVREVMWDADGVLLDSRPLAYEVSERIVSLFETPSAITDPESYQQVFGREAQERLVGVDHAGTLRALHRLLMCHFAYRVHPFASVLDLVGDLTVPSRIITSALGVGIKVALGSAAGRFVSISGREGGTKGSHLLAAPGGLDSYVYVTDSPRDVDLCRNIGLSVIAVGWGYYRLPALETARPDYMAPDVASLRGIFADLGVLRRSLGGLAHDVL